MLYEVITNFRAKDCRASEKLVLKRGARVVFIKNKYFWVNIIVMVVVAGVLVFSYNFV